MAVVITSEMLSLFNQAKAAGVVTSVIFDEAVLPWHPIHFAVHAIELVGVGATAKVEVRLPSGAWAPWVMPDGTEALTIAPGKLILITGGRWTGIQVTVTLGVGGGDATAGEVWLRSSMT